MTGRDVYVNDTDSVQTMPCMSDFKIKTITAAVIYQRWQLVEAVHKNFIVLSFSLQKSRLSMQ